MKAFLVNYNHDPKDWWLEYSFKPEDVTLFDRSDDGVERTFAAITYKSRNMGDVDYDKLSYLIENYGTLPDVFLWSKTNLFKFITPEEYKEVANNQHFTPLLTKHHKTYADRFGVVCDYQGGIYRERNDCWYFNAGLDDGGNFKNWSDWAQYMALPSPQMIPFAPGGSYILTRDTVYKYSRHYYEKMREVLPYAKHPVEAHLCERSYYLLWQ